MDNFWSLENEKQRLINELQLNSPGDEDYEATLKALKSVNNLIPEKPDKTIQWNKITENSVPALLGIVAVVLFEQLGNLFTSKATFFWRK